ncbi:putative nad dependent epimerase [Phaeomoniella chlamydospora]|uniref:Putative nad dependent epimerase n=1 Tax=Phaeomoniella chlamydospora TaxID=158046 RepID=A0A0G2EX23_PHACM|nr:putative nad dependent epimerase [Phaeomoniella chlamydospora]
MSAIKEKIQRIFQSHTSSVDLAPEKQTILITGASGFIAAHVVGVFLEAGYNVRGTVRSEEIAEKVRKTHAKYLDRLSFAIVPDVAADKAFDDAVRDVDGVIHTASPFYMSGIKNNETELLDPAIKGTRNIVEAVDKYAPKVKRVVITSSFASIVDLPAGTRPGHTYSEADWNPVTYAEAADPSALGPVAYCASKVFAERAAWEYIHANKPHFTISTICPPLVYGPLEHNVTGLSKLNTSSADLYRLINGSEKEVPATNFWAFVDVRDVATAHLKAYEVPKAANERFFITAGNFSYQQICDIVRREFPDLKDKVPEGNVASGLGQDVYKVDNGKSKTILGIEYRDLETCVNDTVKSLLEVEKAQGNT